MWKCEMLTICLDLNMLIFVLDTYNEAMWDICNTCKTVNTDVVHSVWSEFHHIERTESLIMSWWRHQMETFSAFMAICAGNSPVPGEFPTQRPVTRSFDVYFVLSPNKRLSKQSWGWWFETLSPPLWRHRNVFFTLLWIWPRSVHWRPVSCCRESPSCRGWEEFVVGRSQGDYGEGRGGRVRLVGEQGTRQQ